MSNEFRSELILCASWTLLEMLYLRRRKGPLVLFGIYAAGFILIFLVYFMLKPKTSNAKHVSGLRMRQKKCFNVKPVDISHLLCSKKTQSEVNSIKSRENSLIS